MEARAPLRFVVQFVTRIWQGDHCTVLYCTVLVLSVLSVVPTVPSVGVREGTTAMLVPAANDRTTNTVPRCPTSAKRRRALPLLPLSLLGTTTMRHSRDRGTMHSRRAHSIRVRRQRRVACVAATKVLVACGCFLSVATTVSAFCGTFTPRFYTKQQQQQQQQGKSPWLEEAPSSTARRRRMVGGVGGEGIVDMAASAAPIGGKSGRSERALSCNRRIRRPTGGAARGGMPLSMVAVMETPPPAAAVVLSTTQTLVPPCPTRRASGRAGGDGGNGSSRGVDGMLPPAGMANPMSPLSLRLIPTSEISEVRRGRRRDVGVVGRLFPTRAAGAVPCKRGRQRYTIVGGR